MLQTLGNLPIGSLVKDPNTTFYGAPIIWKVCARNYSGFPVGSTTLISDKILTGHMIDGKEPQNSDDNRQKYGNNYWKVSNLRQWLNSSGNASEWYTPQHSTDTPPVDGNGWYNGFGYDDEPGFMSGFSNDFKNNLLETTYSVNVATADGGGTESITDKIFLPTRKMVGTEGSVAFPIFTNNNDRICYFSTQGVNYYNKEISDHSLSLSTITSSTARYWWLSDVVSNLSYISCCVGASGASEDYSHSTNSSNGGVRPVCNLRSSTPVSVNQNLDGTYEIISTSHGWSNRIFSYTIGSGDIVSGVVESDNNLLFDYSKYTNFAYIKKILKKNVIYPRFRLFFCNQDGTIKEQIPQEDILMGGSYSENYQNGQRRSLSFTLINDTGKYTPGINSIWANTLVSLEVGLEVPEINGIIWFQKGIFSANSVKPSHSQTNQTVAVDCGDKFSILEGKMGALTDTVEIPYGSNIEDIINDILKNARGDGFPLDSAPILYHSSFKDKVTPLTISETSGSSWGAILLQLAEVLSAEIFYNAQGRLTIVPIVEVTSDGDKPVLFDYIDKDGDFVNDDFSFNMNDFVNKIVVIGANINGHTVMAEAVNNDASSPLSYQKIGYRTAAPINDSNITNDFLAQERADYELRKVLIAKTTISSNVFLNPILSVNNLITYTDSFYSFERERLLLQSISFSLDYSGLMSINSSNIKNLPFVV